jgi:Flp pilus assembly pilin Flp
MRKYLLKWHRNEQGVTSVEYALIILLVVIGIVGFVSQIGSNTSKPFKNAGDAINGTVSP